MPATITPHPPSSAMLTVPSVRWGVALLCLTALVAGSGCRSGMPRMNMFGWRKSPSAETLAGSGPTTTYPVPPSAGAQPEAIASVAGGTAKPANVASASPPGVPITQGSPAPGTANSDNPYAVASRPATNSTASGPVAPPPTYAAPANATNPYGGSTTQPPPNYAAAAANGYPVANAAASRSTPPASPAPAGPSSSVATGSPNKLAAGVNPAASSGGSPSAFVMPSNVNPPTASSVTTSSPPTTTNSPAMSGFVMPGGPTNSAVSPSPNVASTPAYGSPATGAISLPPSTSDQMPSAAGAVARSAAASTPAMKTATAPPNVGSSAAGNGSVQPVGYQPGSTGTSTRYPGSSPLIR